MSLVFLIIFLYCAFFATYCLLSVQRMRDRAQFEVSMATIREQLFLARKSIYDTREIAVNRFYQTTERTSVSSIFHEVDQLDSVRLRYLFGEADVQGTTHPADVHFGIHFGNVCPMSSIENCESFPEYIIIQNVQ